MAGDINYSIKVSENIVGKLKEVVAALDVFQKKILEVNSKQINSAIKSAAAEKSLGKTKLDSYRAETGRINATLRQEALALRKTESGIKMEKERFKIEREKLKNQNVADKNNITTEKITTEKIRNEAILQKSQLATIREKLKNDAVLQKNQASSSKMAAANAAIQINNSRLLAKLETDRIKTAEKQLDLEHKERRAIAYSKVGILRENIYKDDKGKLKRKTTISRDNDGKITTENQAFNTGKKRSFTPLGISPSAIVGSYGVYKAYDGAREIYKAEIERQGLSYSLPGAAAKFHPGKNREEIFKEEMKYLYDTSNKLGISMEASSKSYMQILAASRFTLPETRKIFESVAGQGRLLGLSKEQQQMLLLGIRQVMGKGRLQGQEYTQQINEALPGSIDYFNEALGKHLGKKLKPGEFESYMREGKISDKILLGYASAMSEKNIDNILQSKNSLGGQANIASNEVYMLKQSLGNLLGESVFNPATVKFAEMTKEARQYIDQIKIASDSTEYLDSKNRLLITTLGILKGMLEGSKSITEGVVPLADIAGRIITSPITLADAVNRDLDRDALGLKNGNGMAFKDFWNVISRPFGVSEYDAIKNGGYLPNPVKPLSPQMPDIQNATNNMSIDPRLKNNLITQEQTLGTIEINFSNLPKGTAIDSTSKNSAIRILTNQNSMGGSNAY